MKVTKSPGMLALAVYLLMVGLMGLWHLNFGFTPLVVQDTGGSSSFAGSIHLGGGFFPSIAALVAGVLILLGR